MGIFKTPWKQGNDDDSEKQERTARQSPSMGGRRSFVDQIAGANREDHLVQQAGRMSMSTENRQDSHKSNGSGTGKSGLFAGFRKNKDKDGATVSSLHLFPHCCHCKAEYGPQTPQQYTQPIQPRQRAGYSSTSIQNAVGTSKPAART